MNTIKLERTIRVQTFDALAKVAVARERPEWLAVAKLTKDYGGTIQANDITTQLLGGVPTVVGEKVIQRCVALGLLEQEMRNGPASLSQLGESSLELGQVFVPEERLWRLYYVEDPLIEQVLLHVEPMDDENARDERQRLKEKRNQGHRGTDPGEKCPEQLARVVDDLLYCDSIVGGKPAFLLQSIPEKGESDNYQELKLQLTWKPDHDPKLRVYGKLNAPERRENSGKDDSNEECLMVDHHLDLPNILKQLNHSQLWIVVACFAAQMKQADLVSLVQKTKRLVLPLPYGTLGEREKRTFRRDLPIPAIPYTDELGEFDKATLPSVELIPANEDDAQQWAEWLLSDSINDYATPVRLQQLAAESRMRFEFNSPEMPTPEKLLQEALQNPSGGKSRYLLAPYDLGLWS